MEQPELTWEAFIHQADAAGLDTADTAHMEELFAYAKTQLRATRSFHQLDLSGTVPAGVFSLPNPEPDPDHE